MKEIKKSKMIKYFTVPLLFMLVVGFLTQVPLEDSYASPTQSMQKVEFEHQWNHSFYDEAYTPQISANYNGGVPTPDHIVFGEDFIAFNGYDNPPYFDGVYTQNFLLDHLEFDFNPRAMSFHSMLRTGFWLNSSISADGKISGYMVVIGATTVSNPINHHHQISSQYSLVLVRDMDVGAFNEAVYNTTLNYVKPVIGGPYYPLPFPFSDQVTRYGIPADRDTFLPTARAAGGITILKTIPDSSVVPGGPDRRFRVESDGNSFQVYVTLDGGTEQQLFNQTVADDFKGQRGFGFFMANNPHYCEVHTHIEFGNIYIKTAEPNKYAITNGQITIGNENQPVELQDSFFQYAIEFDVDEANRAANRDMQYDVLFALDYSSSMYHQYPGGAAPPPAPAFPAAGSAMMMAKNTILSMSQKVFNHYPDSRVAVMGMNHNAVNNSAVDSGTDPFAEEWGDEQFWLAADTPFVGKSQYESVIQNAYAKTQLFPSSNESDVLFMRAAINKLDGVQKRYGGDASIPARDLIVRDERDQRIPVLVLISDFQIDGLNRPDTAGKAVQDGYWSDLDKEAQAFKQTFPEGILLTVRTDHNHSKYWRYDDIVRGTTTDADAAMERLIAIGDGRWDWTNYTSNDTQSTMDLKLWNLLQNKMPFEITGRGTPNAVVTDLLPEGIEYVGPAEGSPAPTVTNVGGRTMLRWTLNNPPTGTITLKVSVKATTYDTFVNQADVIVNGVPAVSNTTYHVRHRPPDRDIILHIRQVVDDGAAFDTLAIPAQGYLSLYSNVLNEGSGELFAQIGPMFNEVVLSGKESQTDYTSIALHVAHESNAIDILPVIPMYYEFNKITATPDKSLAEQPLADHYIALNETDHEWWITIYLSPATENPLPYSIDRQTNDFGTME